jgi:hypothetical protein
VSGTSTGATHEHQGSCGGSGPDRVYRIVSPATRSLSVTVTPSVSYRPVVYLVKPGTYLLLVDTQTTFPGSFTLNALLQWARPLSDGGGGDGFHHAVVAVHALHRLRSGARRPLALLDERVRHRAPRARPTNGGRVRLTGGSWANTTLARLACGQRHRAARAGQRAPRHGRDRMAAVRSFELTTLRGRRRSEEAAPGARLRKALRTPRSVCSPARTKPCGGPAWDG